MNPITIKVAITLAQQASKHWKTIVLVLLTICFLFTAALFAILALIMNSSNSGTQKLNENVLAWQPVVQEYAFTYGVEDYVDVLLAIMMVESGGKGPDVMQSSESLGLPPNSITDSIYSIDAGVRHFANVVKNAQQYDLDFWTPVQSYNYGSGFNNYVRDNGKQYTFELASQFANNLANGKTVKYSNPIADFNGNFRYAYGNMYYVMLIQQYLSPGSIDGNVGNADASALGSDAYVNLMNEVHKYNGWPYVWAGASPNVGFDCSGLTQYAFRQIGYSLPRTAAEQYKYSIPVADPQPGDLVFFKGTYGGPNHISHVGIYVDENRMYDANNSGIGYSNWSQGYWKQHFAGFGRVVK